MTSNLSPDKVERLRGALQDYRVRSGPVLTTLTELRSTLYTVLDRLADATVEKIRLIRCVDAALMILEEPDAEVIASVFRANGAIRPSFVVVPLLFVLCGFLCFGGFLMPTAIPSEPKCSVTEPSPALVAAELQRSNQFGTAADVWATAAKNAPGKPATVVALREQAYCLLRAGRPGEALSVCDKLAIAEPAAAHYHYLRGIISEKTSPVTAAEHYRLALLAGEPMAAYRLDCVCVGAK